MFMTAGRIKLEGKPVLKLNIHEYSESDLSFLDELGIDLIDEDFASCRYKLIQSQEEFIGIRTAIFKRYEVTEKGPRAFLTLK